MSSILIPLGVFFVVFGGALFGILLRQKLPEPHRDGDTKEAVQLVLGPIAMMAALVLSLLISSSHGLFETQQGEVQKLAADVILLDEALGHYGPEAAAIRSGFRDDVVSASRAMSPNEGFGSASITVAGADNRKKHLFAQVLALEPKSAFQRYDQNKALDLMSEIATTRLIIHEQASASVPTALILVLTVWLTLLFFGFGLVARVNGTVLASFGFGAFSVATAIFLIVDMGHPYQGLIHVSRAPIQNALDQIGR
jgi:hypothetical protein